MNVFGIKLASIPFSCPSVGADKLQRSWQLSLAETFIFILLSSSWVEKKREQEKHPSDLLLAPCLTRRNKFVRKIIYYSVWSGWTEPDPDQLFCSFFLFLSHARLFRRSPPTILSKTACDGLLLFFSPSDRISSLALWANYKRASSV